MLTGKHLIAGQWLVGEGTFTNEPVAGEADRFSSGTVALVNKAVEAAEDAFWSYSQTTAKERAAFLNRIADEIEARGADLTAIGAKETGLPEARLEGERGRTTGQLRLFAEHILKGDYLDRRFDAALPDRAPLPRPDLRMMQRPIGPVAVFGASNFPLAFSTAGGDTASALAAGCPVVVRGHFAHPGVSDVIAQAIDVAIKACGMHPGVFSQVQGGDLPVGAALVQHPLIKAVGFTGSLRGGRALFDLCAARPEPIPFFGELGSVNPMFMMPNAVASRGAALGQAWAASLTMGAGQFCTNPGVAVVIDNPDTRAFIDATVDALGQVDGQTMLTSGIASAYDNGQARLSQNANVETLLATDGAPRKATPFLFETTVKKWLEDDSIGHEVFGPLGVVVVASDEAEVLELAKSLDGQLTCTLHLDAEDHAAAGALLPVLERKAGRVLANGFPTGVEVCDSMVHGGPYPASTNFGATSVGTMAIRRFLRPVCYQNIPAELLPADLA